MQKLNIASIKTVVSASKKQSVILPFNPNADEYNYTFVDASDFSPEEANKLNSAVEQYVWNDVLEESGNTLSVEKFLGSDLYNKAVANSNALQQYLKNFDMVDGGLWVNKTTKKAVHCPSYDAPYTNFIVYQEWDSVKGRGEILRTTDFVEALQTASK